MRHRGLIAWVLACALATSARGAAADDLHLYDRMWPSVPTARQLTLGQQLTDAMTDLGNQLGYHLDQLSNDTFALRFDGRQRRARVKFGMIDSDYATFKFDSVVHFTNGMAKITAVFDIGIAGRVVHLELPEIEMLPTEYHGERGVQLRVPVYRAYF
ncbi:MAG: hypothetical protein JNL83_25740 [Myxococcales bacterium]|nr:hypothetical protein [Myxococcales bacterium]